VVDVWGETTVLPQDVVGDLPVPIKAGDKVDTRRCRDRRGGTRSATWSKPYVEGPIGDGLVSVELREAWVLVCRPRAIWIAPIGRYTRLEDEAMEALTELYGDGRRGGPMTLGHVHSGLHRSRSLVVDGRRRGALDRQHSVTDIAPSRPSPRWLPTAHAFQADPH